MGRSFVAVAVAIAGARAGMMLAACGSGAVSSTGASPAATTATPVVAPATWTGVFERVTAHLDNEGSVSPAS